MRKALLFLSSFVLLSAFGQDPLSSGYTNYHLLDRYEVLGDSFANSFFTSVKPISRKAIARFASGIAPTSKTDSFNKVYLQRDNYPWADMERSDGLFGSFFQVPNALYSVHEERFQLVLNPVIGWSGASSSSDSLAGYRNSRGFEARGTIGTKLGFYTYALENQVRFPQWMRDRHAVNNVVYGTTLAKHYGNQSRDFFNVAGYLTFSPIKEIQVQFGQDKNFIGNGYRSLLLSDVSTSYPFLKINTKVWKVNYMNLYAQHRDYRGYNEKAPSLRKYSALHHLSINLTKNINVGIFENVIFDRQDSLESDRFDFNYYNPIIFYRAVEHGLNSSDNVMVGMDWKINFLKRFSCYGQLIFDEFIKDEFFKATSSWTNKWGYQAGLKYINVANISNLDLQLEVNQIRPHVYQHRSKSQNWVHYDQSLAHPSGSNLREWLGIVRYQPMGKLTITGMVSSMKQGLDSSLTGANYGSDLTRDGSSIYSVNNTTIFQGIPALTQVFSLDASYMIYHNLFVDVRVIQRSFTKGSENLRSNRLIEVGLRLNAGMFDYRN